MKALDLFCGAGGASTGLYRAGFEVVGVDVERQPNYPFKFIQADALECDLDGFDFIWASPPCQDYSTLKVFADRSRGKLIGPIRERLTKSGALWTIENVVGSDLRNPITLCGSSFGLGVWRHRNFESNFPIPSLECRHELVPEPIDVTGTGGRMRNERKKPTGGQSRKPINLAQARKVMGIDWMTRREISQAIPPAYSEFIGRAAIQALRLAA